VLHLLLPAAASFGLTLLAIFALRPLAIAVDLVDRPGGRKTHFGDVPIVGGLAMLLGIVLGGGLLPPQAAPSADFFAACALLVTVGLVDDRFEISPWARLPVQIVAAMILVIGASAVVTTLGDPLGTGPIEFTKFGSVIFTVAIVMAAINAFNMLDGLDGLAGAIALIGFIAIAIVSGADGRAGQTLVIAGSVAAFLVFNMPSQFNRRVRCFMGDSGSTLLGFGVAWLCIQVSQGTGREVAPVTTLWVFALPVYEVVWSTARRLLRGTSPFRPDSKHFHHLLLAAGFGVRGTFAILATLALMLAAFGVIAHQAGVSDTVSFALLAVCGVAVVCLTYRAEILWKVIPTALKPVFSRPVEPVSAKPGGA
jgi:UDP-GlcNAc:undecaprenyl-phosphate/decaprenyl-phosphate GlcNAc-1-phosphate transferase